MVTVSLPYGLGQWTSLAWMSFLLFSVLVALCWYVPTILVRILRAVRLIPWPVQPQKRVLEVDSQSSPLSNFQE